MALVYVALAWAGGLVAASNAPGIAAQTWLLIGIGGAAAWFVARHERGWRIAFALLTAFAIAASHMAFQPRTSQLAALNGGGGATVEGIVIDPPDQRDLYVQVRIDVDTVATTSGDATTDGLAVARLPPQAAVRYGDRLRVTGRLRTPDEGDAFSYADYLARRGVFTLIDRVADVEIVSRGHGSPLTELALDARDAIRRHVSALLPEPHAGILAAILTGDERGISSETEAVYAASGLAHLLAVSGFNMTLVAGVGAMFAKRSDARQWLWVCLGVAMIVLYTLVVGFSASAFRAAVMATLVLFGISLRRDAYLPVSLAAALIVLTAIDPSALFDLGFQLSFGAVLGIALIGTPLSRRVMPMVVPDVPKSPVSSIAAVAAESLIITVAASALTMPLIGLTFGRLPLVSLAANILVVPVQPAVMALGTFMVLAAPIPIAAQTAAWAALVPLSWTTAVARIAANAPAIAVNLHPSLVGGVFLAAVGASMANATQPDWLRWARSRQVSLVAGSGLLVLVVLAIGLVTSQPDGQLHVWFLDVGHTNAVLIQSPDGAQILVDGGRYPSRLITAIGERLPFNDTSLDAIILTQPDPGDIAAAAAVLRRYNVAAVFTNGQPNLGAELADIASLVSLTPVTAGATLDIGSGAAIEILHPRSTPELADALDDVPLTLRVRFGDVSILLPGDASREAQTALLNDESWPLASVLALPRHGGTLDADLLDAAQPSAIVIQTDRANLLGHPNPDVLAMLPSGVPVYRTDIHGALHFATDGRELFLTTEH